MSEILFLPHLRTGLALGLDRADPLTGGVPGAATVTAYVEVAGTRVEHAVRLLDAGAATGLAAGEVIRTDPTPNAVDVEPNYFAVAELAGAGTPWLLTPAAPASRDRLRPWLVLIVVEEQDGVTLTPATTTAAALLTISDPASPAAELPDLNESWAWAHVQSTVSAEQVEDAVAGRTGQVVARLICPRRMLPGRRYTAAVVPAFVPGPDGLEPAWDLATIAPAISLPVYHSWSFTTGEGADFEALCRRLLPDTGDADLGLHPMDISAPGIVPPAEHPVVVDMRGALLTLDAQPAPWRARDREPFQEALRPVVDAGIGRGDVSGGDGPGYDPLTDDPVVAPPGYGSLPAGVAGLPRRGWLPELNLDPVNRAAAGIGAGVVRAGQEAYVAAAWTQAGELQAAAAILNRARLALEVSRSLTARAATLPDGDLLRLTSRLHAVLPGDGSSVAELVRSSQIPTGLSWPSALRSTRPGTPLARDFTVAGAAPAGGRLGGALIATTLAATVADPAPGVLAVREFAAFGLPDGAQVEDLTLTGSGVQPVARPAGRTPSAGRTAPGGTTLPLPGVPVTSTRVISELRARLDPAPAMTTALLATVSGLAEELAGASLGALAVAPVFDDALYWDVLALGSHWLVPGLGALAANRVRLVEVNPDFVASCLLGANHELARELMWRGYPVDPGATFFHRFWDYVDPSRTDLGDVRAQWDRGSSLAENLGVTTDVMTAVVIRGDIVARYPDAHWYLHRAETGAGGEWVPVGEAEAGAIEEVAFLGLLDADTLVLGFDLAPETVRGTGGDPGYFVAVEEQPAGPRFGLDVESPSSFTATPTTWDDVSWGHLVDGQAALDALTHAPVEAARIDGLELDGARWGRNAAHQGRATWQRPFRMLIRADSLI